MFSYYPQIEYPLAAAQLILAMAGMGATLTLHEFRAILPAAAGYLGPVHSIRGMSDTRGSDGQDSWSTAGHCRGTRAYELCAQRRVHERFHLPRPR